MPKAKKPTGNSRSRGWCLTINNPPTGIEFTLEFNFHELGAKYAVYQLEVGEAGTPHIQAYFYWSTLKAFSQIKEAFPSAHIEPQRGTAQENKTYCTKDEGRLEGPWEFGEVPQAGKRNDLEDIQRKLDVGVPLSDISKEHFGSFVRYGRGFKEYMLMHRQPRNWPMEISVYWGPSGTGKSRSLLAEYPHAFWKTKNSGQMQFWDGYDGQQEIIIDEFYGWMSYDYLLRLCDRYPFSLEVKHGTVPIAAKKILFSSNKHPKDWYHYERLGVPPWDTFQRDGTPFNPLQRRINRIVHFHGTGGEHEPTLSTSVRITTGSPFDN